MSTITVLGSATVDFVVRQPRLADHGETVFGSSLTTVPGGKGVNQAIAAARAGGDVGFLGVVGDDDLGLRVRTALTEAAVATDAVRTVPGTTGTAHIAVLDGGENAITIVPAANAAITSFDDHAALDGTRFLVSQFERPVPLIHQAFAAARERGIVTVLTPAPVVAVPSGFLDLVDILIPNALEACLLTGTDDPREAADRLSRSVGLVVMTRGKHGALVVRNGQVVADISARRVDAVDTTAAGDAFAGALVAWLADDAPLEDALLAATAAASLCVTRLGTSSTLAHRAEIDAVLAGWPTPPRHVG